MKTVLERFLKYVEINTQSSEDSSSSPSTQSQLTFAMILADECKKIGLSEVKVNPYGYMTATLKANTTEIIPSIGFIAHMDTSPDASGENIKPKLTEHYNGGDIKLKGLTLSPEEFPTLLDYIGDTIITADGTTLLGADDKAGIAEILTALEYLVEHPEIKHGTIRICFTPDEEIGQGVAHFDVGSFGADFAYTVDGGKIGELEYENFNAAKAVVTIKGKSVHPGTAKGIMINAGLIAAELVSALPEEETPAQTDQYDGFYHLVSISGTVKSAKATFIIRDFDMKHFENRKAFLMKLVADFNKKYQNALTIEIRDEYFNMVTKIKEHMHVVDLACEAFKACGITPIIQPIRGGTDGAGLSFMGLPCPNLFAGGHNFHGPYEYIPLTSMEKAVSVLIKIAELNAVK